MMTFLAWIAGAVGVYLAILIAAHAVERDLRPPSDPTGW